MERTKKHGIRLLAAVCLFALTALLLLLTLPALRPVTANAAVIVESGACGADGDDLTWTLDSDGLLTISGTGAIENYAFHDFQDSNYLDLFSVVIQNGVTSIGDDAFSFCTELTSVTIPNSVTNIGENAFSNCTELTSVTIPNGVTSIGSYAFSYCTGLVTIPNGVTSIEHGEFFGCTGLTSVTIPNGVTSIGEEAFYGCTELTSVTIPNSVTNIGEHAFYGCTGLTSITIPNSVTSIGEAAFSRCTGLTSVTIPNGVTSIGEEAFSCCTGLTSVTIPNSVTSIGEAAFYGCTGLTSITIPNSVTSIGTSAFEGCTGLTSVTIPNGLTNIGLTAFNGCKGLSSIKVAEGNPVYHSKGNCLIETSEKTLILGCKNSTIPSDGSVTSIEYNAFGGCTGLTSVTIPNTVTSIGTSAFEGCTGLSSITVAEGNPVYHSKGNCIIETSEKTLILGCKNSTIPSDGSVTSIGDSAFINCTELTSVLIPYGITSIADLAFYGCTGLTSVTIPNSVTFIGMAAFRECSGLQHVYYTGDGAAWFEIDISHDNNELLYAEFHYNTVLQESLQANRISLYSATVVYNGKVRTPSVTVKNAAGEKLTAGTDYTVTVPSGRTNAGTYTYKITGKGNYAGTVNKTFTINAQALSAANVSLYSATVTYNGKVRTPSVTVKNAAGEKLTAGTDYTVTVPTGRTNAGTYTYKITGKGNYSGTVSKVFTINAQALSAANATLYSATVTYNGKVRTPSVTVKNAAGEKLTAGTDYTVTVPTGRTNAGTYTYKITGKGNYSGTVSKTFTIKAQTLQAANATLYSATVTYNGKVRTPSVTVKNAAGEKLTAGTDYTVTVPTGRTNAGTYTYKITGKGNYSGTVSKVFTINAQTLSAANVSLYSETVTYNGKVRTPKVTVKNAAGETLVEGTDYTVTVPAGRKEVGVYEYTITGKGNYAGTVKKNFTIR